ncbi:MAG: DUF523 domain-containing protein [Colwellia sp.]|nr:DUF523 domain-containing protein [Colwellia sp.]
MEKILTSACFLGHKVRYDGRANSLSDEIIQQWKNQERLISICPEVSGGLNTPRPAAEIQINTISDVWEKYSPSCSQKTQSSKTVLTHQGIDVSDAFYQGAQIALRLCQRYKIRFALMKESSPSCGSHNIYDGSFTKNKISGEGITVALLREHGIEVFSENNIMSLADKLHEIEAVKIKGI